jgi:hypothetical protein
MTTRELLRQRLLNQHIAKPVHTDPEEVVSLMGAMQAQEYAMAKWAVGLRCKNVCAIDVERAISEGRILRTHLLRPTWHFVTPADIRWMLKLTAPGIRALSAYMMRKVELTSPVLLRSQKILEKTLAGHQYKTRSELQDILIRSRIDVRNGIRLSYVMMIAELDAQICSGPRKGKQSTYALLDERIVPRSSKQFNREESLNELARRYYQSRGPATVHDFAGWCGMSIRDSKNAVENIRHEFLTEKVNGVEFIFPTPCGPSKIRSTFLMPDYDEFGMAYKDRSALIDGKIKMKFQRDGSTVFNRWVVVNGKLAGTWTKTESAKQIDAELTRFAKFSGADETNINKAYKEYVSFWSEDPGKKSGKQAGKM